MIVAAKVLIFIITAFAVFVVLLRLATWLLFRKMDKGKD